MQTIVKNKTLTAVALAIVALTLAIPHYLQHRASTQFVTAAGPAFARTECPANLDDGPHVICGRLRTPAADEPDTDSEVELPIVILHPRNASGHGVLVTGGGGPGSSIGFDEVEAAHELLPALGAMLDAGHTVVLVEERGVGASTPEGVCEQMPAAEDARWRARDITAGVLAQRTEAVAECRVQLQAEGFAPEDFSLARSAADMALTAETLPLERWTLFGHSHGTVVALATAATEPAGIERVVLSAPVGLGTEQPLSYREMRRRVARALAACEADSDCHEAFPAIVARLDSLLDDLDVAPLPLSLLLSQAMMLPLPSSIDERLDRVLAYLDDERLLDVLFEQAYWPDTLAGVPLLVAEVSEGDTDAMVELVAEHVGGEATAGDWPALSVDCAFYLPRQRRYLAEHEAEFEHWRPESLVRWRAQARDCAAWGAPDSQLDDDTLLALDVPVLLVAGELDPITPAAGARAIAARLADARLFVDPLGGHSVLDDNACAQAWLLGFLEDAPADDEACDQPAGTIDWVLE